MKSKKKIVLIGPIAPFRGGISQYNTQLHKSLRTKCDLKTLSFKRLYPSWLYPGKTDKEDSRMLAGVNYILDAYSPFSLRKTIKEILTDKPEAVIITWWTLFWQPGMAYISYKLKRHNIKTIFLCHNVADHDAKKIRRKISSIFLKQGAGYIVHSSDETKELKRLTSSSNILNIKSLPTYNHYPKPIKKLTKRGRLELLFFGFIRPYKGLDILFDALHILNDPSVYLTVVGEPWENPTKIKDKVRELGLSNSVELILEYVNDSDAAKYFDRADIVVLPYKSATGSAVTSLAFHYGKPVLASRVGGLKDVIIENETGWLVKPNSSESLFRKLYTLSRAQAQAMNKPINRFNNKNSWENLSDSILKFITN